MMLKSCFIVCFLFITGFQMKAQDDNIAAALKKQLYNKDYDKIIKENAALAKDYPALAVYYVGRAYFMKNDDENCIRMMNIAITKDPKLADAYFTKGVSQYFEGENEKALKNLQSAISINPKNSEYYTALGDVYFKNEVFAEALNAYQDALKQETPPDRAYTMLGQTYFALKKNEKALEAYKIAKTKINPISESYSTALFNIGLLEILNANYKNAETALKELIDARPNDYRAIAKLIQVYYGEKEYDKARPYKEFLYAAYKTGSLKTSLKEMFCFDQFKWKDKQIEAYEKFNEPKENGDVKMLFYVVNSNDDIEYKLQSEYEPVLLEQQGSNKKYQLCKEQSEYHATYNFWLNDHTVYDTVKKGVIDVLDGKLKPEVDSGK
jgi:tetratricopeptide (TPR) repeat protein